MALRAAALIVPQPVPLRAVAANSCHGVVAPPNRRCRRRGERPGFGDGAAPRAPMQPRQPRAHDGAGEKMNADGRRPPAPAASPSPRGSRSGTPAGRKSPIPQPNTASTKAAPTTRQPWKARPFGRAIIVWGSSSGVCRVPSIEAPCSNAAPHATVAAEASEMATSVLNGFIALRRSGNGQQCDVRSKSPRLRAIPLAPGCCTR